MKLELATRLINWTYRTKIGKKTANWALPITLGIATLGHVASLGGISALYEPKPPVSAAVSGIGRTIRNLNLKDNVEDKTKEITPELRAQYQARLNQLLDDGRSYVDSFLKTGNSKVDLGRYLTETHFLAHHLDPDAKYLLQGLPLERVLEYFESDSAAFGSRAQDPTISRKDLLQRLDNVVLSRSAYDPDANLASSHMILGQNCQTRTIVKIGIVRKFPELLEYGERIVLAHYADSEDGHHDFGIYNGISRTVILSDSADKSPVAIWAPTLYDPHILIQSIIDYYAPSGMDYDKFLVADANLQGIHGKTKVEREKGAHPTLSFHPRTKQSNSSHTGDITLRRNGPYRSDWQLNITSFEPFGDQKADVIDELKRKGLIAEAYDKRGSIYYPVGPNYQGQVTMKGRDLDLKLRFAQVDSTPPSRQEIESRLAELKSVAFLARQVSTRELTIRIFVAMHRIAHYKSRLIWDIDKKVNGSPSYNEKPWLRELDILRKDLLSPSEYQAILNILLSPDGLESLKEIAEARKGSHDFTRKALEYFGFMQRFSQDQGEFESEMVTSNNPISRREEKQARDIERNKRFLALMNIDPNLRSFRHNYFMIKLLQAKQIYLINKEDNKQDKAPLAAPIPSANPKPAESEKLIEIDASGSELDSNIFSTEPLIVVIDAKLFLGIINSSPETIYSFADKLSNEDANYIINNNINTWWGGHIHFAAERFSSNIIDPLKQKIGAVPGVQRDLILITLHTSFMQTARAIRPSGWNEPVKLANLIALGNQDPLLLEARATYQRYGGTRTVESP